MYICTCERDRVESYIILVSVMYHRKNTSGQNNANPALAFIKKNVEYLEEIILKTTEFSAGLL